MAKLIPVLFAVLLAVASQSSSRPEGLPSAAEFPPQDMALWSLVSQDIVTTGAASLI